MRIAKFFLVFLFVLQPFTLLKPLSAQDNDILITGMVTSEANGAPLADVAIIFVDSNFPLDTFTAAHTDSSGRYTATQTLLASWWIQFDAPGDTYLTEFYDNHHIAPGATIFTYSPGMVRSGIDAALTPIGTGQITGQVTGEPDDKPLENVYVDVYTVSGQLLKSNGPTDSTGTYTVTELAAGGYKLRFTPGEVGLHYALEYYEGATSASAAEVINVGEGEKVTGIDVSLDVNGIIAGFVTSSGTGAKLSTRIDVYTLDNEYIPFIGPFDDENGSYIISNLPVGEYHLFFRDYLNEHRPEYYNDKLTLDQAQAVAVTAGNLTTINVELAITPTVVSIATSPALPNDIVLLLKHDPAPRFTTNGGQSWHSVVATPWMDGIAPPYQGDTNINSSLALAPREGLSGRRILFENNMGLYRSGDGGQSWTKQVPLSDCSESGVRFFNPFMVKPSDPNRFYMIEECNSPGDGFMNTSSIIVSSDAGVTWQPLPVVIDGQEQTHVREVVPSSVIAERIYAGWGWGWGESNDNGEQWTAMDFPVEISHLVPDGEDAAVLYGWSGAYNNPPDIRHGMRSENNGDTWVKWEQQLCTTGFFPPNLVAHPTQTKLLFLRCDSGLYRSENGGDAWEKLSSTGGSLLVLDNGVPGRLLWAKADGLFASTDKGDSWQVLMPNYTVSPAQAVSNQYLPSVSANER